MGNSQARFRVIEEKFGTKSLVKLTDSKTGEFVSIFPFLGGSVNQLVFLNNGALIDIVDGYSSEQDAGKNLLSSFKGSNLFPFPNRISDGKYTADNKDFQLPVNFPQENNAIHGLVFDKEFQVVNRKEGDTDCALELSFIHEEPSQGYPFRYSLEILYRLTEQNFFICSTKITNLTDTSIPVGHGWHPYFKAGNIPVDELYLQFPAKEVLEVDKRNIPTGNTFQYNTFNTLRQVADTSLDHCFLLDTGCGEAEILLAEKSTGLSFKIWQETGKGKYNYLQIYTPPARKSIAIEPMTCAPDAFNNKMGLIMMAPDDTISATWGIAKE